MPYYRGYRSRNSRYRQNYRRRYRARYKARHAGSASTRDLAGKALTAAKWAVANLNTERKFIRNTFAHTGAKSTVSSCTHVGQGVDEDERTGNRIKQVYNGFKCQYSLNTSASHTLIRTMIVMKKDNSGTAPAITDILESDNIRSFYNRDNIHDFIVLYDKVHLVHTYKPEIMFWINIRRHFRTRFSGAGNTNAAVARNGIYYITTQDEATNFATMGCTYTGKYIDN